MAKVGYARVSTAEQSVEIQINNLKSNGCHKIFSDKASASNSSRPEFVKMMEYLRAGDTLVITKIDRIARSVLDLQKLIAELKKKEIALEAIDQPISTDTASGKAFLDMLGVFAEFELNIRKERQMEGIERAKNNGKYTGRKPLSTDVKAEVNQLYSQCHNKTAVARALGLSRNSVYKLLGKI